MKYQFFACLALTTLCGSIFGAATEAQAGSLLAKDVKDIKDTKISVDVDFNGKKDKIELKYKGEKEGYDEKHVFYELGANAFSLESGEDIVQIDDISSDPDPVGTFGVTFTDFGAASTFSFTVNYGISPIIYNDIFATASLGLSMTDSAFKDGISITPNSTLSPQTVTSYKFYGNNNANSGFLNFGLGKFEQSSGSNPTSSYNYFSANNLSNICNALGGCTSYDIKLDFKGSGGGDKYVFTGALEFEEYVPPANGLSILSVGRDDTQAVPEPSSIIGLIGMGSALGFGSAFKRKLGKKKDQNKA